MCTVELYLEFHGVPACSAAVHTQLLVIKRIGQAEVRSRPHLNEIPHSGQCAEEPPADEAYIQSEKLPFMAVHHALALAYALHWAVLRMVDEDVIGHAVSICGYESGYHEEERPKRDEDTLEYAEEYYLPEKAEAVQQILKACARAADSVEQEYHEADRDDGHDHVEQELHGIRRERRADAVEILHGIPIVAVHDMLRVLGQVLLRYPAAEYPCAEVRDKRGESNIRKPDKHGTRA